MPTPILAAPVVDMAPNHDQLYLGIGFVLSALIAGVTFVLSRKFPKVDKRIWTIASGAVIGCLIIILAIKGLPEPSAITRAIVRALPFVGIVLWTGLVVYLGLSAQSKIDTVYNDLTIVEDRMRGLIDPKLDHAASALVATKMIVAIAPPQEREDIRKRLADIEQRLSAFEHRGMPGP